MHAPPESQPERTGSEARRSGAGSLRILHVVEAAFAGTGRHVVDLVRGTVAAGHEVHLIYSPRRMEPGFGAELAALGSVPMTALPMHQGPSAGDLATILAVRRYLRRHGPFDVIHGHSSKGGAVARLAAIGLGSRRVYTAHAFKSMDPTLGTGARLLYGGIEVLLGRTCTDIVIAVSEEERSHAVHLGIQAERCRYVPNAAQLPAQLPERGAARRSFGVPWDAPCLLFIGRLAPQKAPQRFVELVGALAAGMPGLRALMLGYGPLEPAVREQIHLAGLDDRIALFTDRRGWDGIAAADLLVVTSDYEGMPYVLLEAAALGLPIVTTEVGGARRVVVPGENGLIVPPGDAAALETAVRTVLGDPARFMRAHPSAWTTADMVAATLGTYREGSPARIGRWRCGATAGL